MVGELEVDGGFATHTIASELLGFAKKLFPYWRPLQYSLVGRRLRVRISICSFLIIRVENRYCLIKSFHRPGEYGPVGGVIKYDGRNHELNHQIEFEQQYRGLPGTEELKDDLRGYVDGRNLYRFVRWFERGECRETAVECLNREIHEELSEVDAPFNAPQFTGKDFVKVRTIHEGPKRVPNHDYRQFHIFEVYDLSDSENAKELKAQLSAFALKSSDVIFVTPSQIYSGRVSRPAGANASGAFEIGRHSEFLLRNYSKRPESAPMLS